MQPEQHALHGRLRRQQQNQADQRTASGRENHAGEQQPVEVPVASTEAQSENGEHGCERSNQASQLRRRVAQPQSGRRQQPEPGTARDAKHVGIRQRIAQQHLQQRSGQRQQSAAGEARPARAASGPRARYRQSGRPRCRSNAAATSAAARGTLPDSSPRHRLTAPSAANSGRTRTRRDARTAVTAG